MKKMKFLLQITLLILFSTLSITTAKETIHKAHLTSGWYSQNKEKLENEIQNYLEIAKQNFDVPVDSKEIKALIVPHAGIYFSGLCAASGYQTLLEINNKNKNVNKVVILAPSHAVAFSGIALPDYTKYQTVLGTIQVEKEATEKLKENDLFKINTKAHSAEHSIEIQFPFLQSTIENFKIIPLIVGQVNNQEIENIAKQISQIIDEKTLIIISSDFVHHGSRFNYKPFTENILHSIRQVDSQAIEAITNQSFEKFSSVLEKTKATICGHSAIKILLKILQQKAFGNAEVKLACYYTSPQLENARTNNKIDITKLLKTVPDKNSQNSVSYASLVFATKESSTKFDKEKLITEYEKEALLNLSRQIIKNSFDKKIKESLLSPILSSGLTQNTGAFVTLNKKNGNLRGCIGRIVTPDPLYKTVIEMAKAASFKDSRFSPLKKEELNDIIIDITILSKPRKVENYKDIVLGKHGIILKKNFHTAVFLPQVAPGQGWDLQTTLQHLSQKAGLSKNGWKENCNFEIFEGLEFSE